MKRLAVVVLLLAVALGAFPAPRESRALAQEATDQPEVRTRLTPGDTATVGQPLDMVVEVFVPSYFAGAPRFQDLDLADALVIFNDRGSNLSERRGGQTWAGQTRSYTIYPQRAGRYEIPSVEVVVTYMAPGAGRTTVTSVSGPIEFEAVLPPEAAGLDYFIATSRLQVEEVFSPETGLDRATSEAEAADTVRSRTLRVGEALTRTVTVTVDDALSMVIPPLDLGSPEGLAAYPDPAKVNDTSGERGERIVGTRVESTTFVGRDEGRYDLPAVEVVWWDVSADQLRRATVPGIEVDVVPNPDLVAEFALPADEEGGEVEEAAGASVTLWETIRRWGAPLALVALALVLVMTVARRFGLTWRRIRFLVHKDKESEASYFGAFKRAARAGRPRAVARTFMFWLDRFHAEPGAATYAALSEQAPDPELDSQASALAADLYGRPGKGGSSKFTAARFFRAVARARKAAGRSRIAKHDEPALPFLNPVVRRRR